MSIFGGFGKLFGFSGDEAEAFGSSLVGEGASTFSNKVDKSIDKFDKQVDEYGKITLASDLEDAKVNKKSLNDKVNGISTFARLGFSPAYAAAIYSAPAATQKIMIDAANATEDKSTLDTLWKTSVEINQEMPSLGITDAAKLLIGNQITPERDYSGIPETKNMLTRLGFNANLRDAVKNRVESRPDIGVDLSTDVDGSIPTGGPSKDAMAKAKALNAKDKTASRNTIADSTINLSELESIGFNVTSNIEQLATGLEAGNQLHKLLNFGIDGKGNVVANSMYLTERKSILYSNDKKIKTAANSQGVRLFANEGFIAKMKKLFKSAKIDKDKDAEILAARILDSLKERYNEAAVRDLVQLIK
tara:strand:+ start:1874 stop:2956 length:1083 start_codon:yes stop_codon:yes gene_type:complete